MEDINALRVKFDHAMFEIYRRAKDEANYTATIFLQILTDKKGVATAKQLINARHPSDGYTALYKRQRLDLTVEAEVVENHLWHRLFLPEELERASARLREYHYFPKSRPSN